MGFMDSENGSFLKKVLDKNCSFMDEIFFQRNMRLRYLKGQIRCIKNIDKLKKYTLELNQLLSYEEKYLTPQYF